MAKEMVELHKLKLSKFKQECLAVVLETNGTKSNLISRLSGHLEKHAED